MSTQMRQQHILKLKGGGIWHQQLLLLQLYLTHNSLQWQSFITLILITNN